MRVRRGAWRVVINNRDSGVIETNWAWASVYWAARARITKRKIRLEALHV